MAAHVGHEQQPSAGQDVEPAEHLGHSGEQGPTATVVIGRWPLPHGPVADLAIAVAHEPIEQLGRPNRAPRRRRVPPLQHLHQQGIQPGGVRQIVATAAQQSFAQHGKAAVPTVSQNRQQATDELPPVPQRRPSQVLQALDQLSILVAQLGVFDDGHGPEQLQARLPEVIGGMVAILRCLGVVGAAIELCQGQRQHTKEVFVEGNGDGHRCSSSSVGKEMKSGAHPSYDRGTLLVKQLVHRQALILG